MQFQYQWQFKDFNRTVKHQNLNHETPDQIKFGPANFQNFTESCILYQVTCDIWFLGQKNSGFWPHTSVTVCRWSVAKRFPVIFSLLVLDSYYLQCRWWEVSLLTSWGRQITHRSDETAQCPDCSPVTKILQSIRCNFIAWLSTYILLIWAYIELILLIHKKLRSLVYHHKFIFGIVLWDFYKRR